jgi:hypothetical protein
MATRDRDILERAVRAISEQAANTIKVVDETMEAGLAADHLVTVAAKMLRLELLKTKAELERGLSDFVLNCTACGMEVHWARGTNPGCLSVEACATIELRNSDHFLHSFTIDGAVVNYHVGAGDSTEADLSSLEPSLYDVTRVYHPSMKATLTVE